MLTALLPWIAMSLLLTESSDTDRSIFPGDGAVSVGGEGAHDPTVVQVGDKYFCFHTSGSGFGMVRSSKDLRTWKAEGPLLPSQPTWLAERYNHQSVWAPDVVKLQAGSGERQAPHASRLTLRAYYSVSQWGTNKSVIGLAECERFDPEKPLDGWVDRGLVIESKQGTDVFNAIDPEVCIDQEGRHWLFFGSYFAGIHVVQLDAKTGKLLECGASAPLSGARLSVPVKGGGEAPHSICVARNTSERGNPLEGAAVCYRDGYYYLFVSYGLAGQGVRSTYRIMVGRSKAVTGPFLDANGKSMVDGGYVSVLKSSPPMFSPGHSDVTRFADGRWVMPYHFYDGRHHWVGDMWGRPNLQIRELLWSKDGWPLPGLPVEMAGQAPPGAKRSQAVLTPKGRWVHQVDFGEPQAIELRTGGTIASDEQRNLKDSTTRGHNASRVALGRWTLDGDKLTLCWPKEGTKGEFWTDEVLLAYGGRYYVGRNQQGIVIRGYRLE